MDVDLIYSPRHLTFIMIYMNNYADNTFYYRYLLSPNAILPPYAKGGDPNVDYAESIVKFDWSEEQVLYKTPAPQAKYSYAGGVHAGYFGDLDITTGGWKVLLSWTAPTGGDPSSLQSEYEIVTAEVDFE